MLPDTLIEPLKNHLIRVKALHEEDLQQGYCDVYLPFALERKYPNTGRERGWQYVHVLNRGGKGVVSPLDAI